MYHLLVIFNHCILFHCIDISHYICSSTYVSLTHHPSFPTPSFFFPFLNEAAMNFIVPVLCYTFILCSMISRFVQTYLQRLRELRSWRKRLRIPLSLERLAKHLYEGLSMLQAFFKGLIPVHLGMWRSNVSHHCGFASRWHHSCHATGCFPTPSFLLGAYLEVDHIVCRCSILFVNKSSFQICFSNLYSYQHCRCSRCSKSFSKI